MASYFEVLPDIFARHVATYVGPELESGAFLAGDRVRQTPPLPMAYETGFSVADRLPELMCVSETIFTRGLVDELAAAGVTNLEVFPAELKSTADGTVWGHYVAVNVVGLVACADLSRSEYEDVIGLPGGGRRLYSFSDLKIDAAMADEVPLFRLAESPLVLLMHERVVARLLSVRTAKERRITFIDRS